MLGTLPYFLKHCGKKRKNGYTQVYSGQQAAERKTMKPKKRQKLCHNCEGSIDIDVIVCPFCAADLREERPEFGRSPFSGGVKQLYGAPSTNIPSDGGGMGGFPESSYLGKTHPSNSDPSVHPDATEESASSSLYPPPYASRLPEMASMGEPLEETPSEDIKTEELKSPFLGTIFLTVGVQLVLFGLLMLLFSHRGVILLKWDASYWFVYCLAGGPLLYFGYRYLNLLR